MEAEPLKPDEQPEQERGPLWHAVAWFAVAYVLCLIWNACTGVVVEIGLNAVKEPTRGDLLLPSLILWLIPLLGARMMKTTNARTGWYVGWGLKILGSLSLIM